MFGFIRELGEHECVVKVCYDLLKCRILSVMKFKKFMNKINFKIQSHMKTDNVNV